MHRDASVDVRRFEGRNPGVADVHAVGYATRGRGERKRPTHGWESLTPAERDVADLAARGMRNAEIAEKLFVSLETVKTHLTHVYAKLGLRSRAELAARSRQRA